jgi:hypothetical protein
MQVVADDLLIAVVYVGLAVWLCLRAWTMYFATNWNVRKDRSLARSALAFLTPPLVVWLAVGVLLILADHIPRMRAAENRLPSPWQVSVIAIPFCLCSAWLASRMTYSIKSVGMSILATLPFIELVSLS